jgi:hypothetical protein
MADMTQKETYPMGETLRRAVCALADGVWKGVPIPRVLAISYKIYMIVQHLTWPFPKTIPRKWHGTFDDVARSVGFGALPVREMKVHITVPTVDALDALLMHMMKKETREWDAPSAADACNLMHTQTTIAAIYVTAGADMYYGDVVWSGGLKGVVKSIHLVPDFPVVKGNEYEVPLKIYFLLDLEALAIAKE